MADYLAILVRVHVFTQVVNGAVLVLGVVVARRFGELAVLVLLDSQRRHKRSRDFIGHRGDTLPHAEISRFPGVRIHLLTSVATRRPWLVWKEGVFDGRREAIENGILLLRGRSS